MQKIKVGIFFGGQSREREVSFAGGRTVYDNLNKELFEAIPIFVDSFGNFCLLNWEHVYKGSIRDFYPPTFLHLETQRINCLPELPHGFQVYSESLENLENNRIEQLKLLKEIGNPIEAHEFLYYFDFAFLALHGTHGEDGDPLDALIMLDEPTFPGCVVSCRVIGMFRMTDEKGGDDKLLCVAAGDIRKSNLNDLDDVPIYELDEIKHFFEVYKTLEPGKEVHGGDWVGHDAAEEEILASYKRYNESH